jgi:type II secretory pathway pseudopilin PulG
MEHAEKTLRNAPLMEKRTNQVEMYIVPVEQTQIRAAVGHNMKHTLNSRNKGFTFIELILYVGIVSIVISAATLFAWDIIYGRVKSTIQQEVSQNLRFVSQRIMYEVRNASDSNLVAADSICLANSDAERNPTRIYLNSGRVRIGWGGGTSNCTALTHDEPLTSDTIAVTALSFTDLSSGTDSKNIKFSITVESTADRKEWLLSETYASAVELRSN